MFTHVAASLVVSRRRRVRALAAACVGVLVLLFAPASAFAHAHLVKSAPGAGATLTMAPTQLVLTFTEPPTLAVSALRLLGPDSAAVTLGTPGHGAGERTLTANIIGPLRAGRYTVLWQTAGDDGHVQHGSYQFVVAEGASGLATAPTASSPARPDSVARSSPVPGGRAPGSSDIVAVSVAVPRSFDASSPLYVLVRWVQFAALLLLVGTVAFRWWLLPRAAVTLDDVAQRELAAGAATTGLWASLFLGLTLLARLVAQVATMQGMTGATPTLDAMLAGTVWGHGWLLEVMALIVANFALRMARRDPVSVNAWRAIATATAALAFVPALSGHAVAERTFAPFTLLFDAAHVLAGGTWLGGLAVMAGVGLPVVRRAAARGHREAAAAMVNAFSPLALWSAAILIFTGIVAARLHVGSLAAFTDTSYGRTLLIKLGVVVLLLAVATWNWRRARPRLATDPDAGATALTRSSRLEVGLAVVVLLVTAVLVALPTPVLG